MHPHYTCLRFMWTSVSQDTMDKVVELCTEFVHHQTESVSKLTIKTLDRNYARQKVKTIWKSRKKFVCGMRKIEP